ncbi:DNA ligase LigA-related protein, partial [Bacillus atrophaeus]
MRLSRLDKDILELIGRRRRQILVHSFLYYQLN